MVFKCKRVPRYGEYRKQKRFLLIPRKINGETRWLCKAVITQRFEYVACFLGTTTDWVDFRWED